MKFEGEYKNGERNGKGKGKLNVFHNNKFIFEGEFLNGIRNGKGKLFYDGKIIFEGEYLYDKRIKGKEYLDGRLKYEGYYLNGKRDGEGKEYNSLGSLIYEGEFSKGKKMEWKRKRILLEKW